jgi:hypothetical protein
VLTISNARARDGLYATTERRSAAKTMPARMTMEQFASMFDQNTQTQDGVAGPGSLSSNAAGVNGSTLRNLFRSVPAEARFRRRSR